MPILAERVQIVYRMALGTNGAESCRKNGRTSRVPYNSELGWTRIFFAAYPVNVRYQFAPNLRTRTSPRESG